MSFSRRYAEYFNTLTPGFELPEDVEVLQPYADKEVKRAVEEFSARYMKGENKRILLAGINPGRFGAGVTGISFTDPVHLRDNLGIPNPFDKRAELSSRFIYEMIDYLGGPEKFYGSFYIGSVCPLGFVKNGKNLNYYDDKELMRILEPWIVKQMEAQIRIGINREIAYSIGKGKNLAFLKSLNAEHKWFKKIDSIPHPRWVLQYRLKQKEEILENIGKKLGVWV